MEDGGEDEAGGQDDGSDDGAVIVWPENRVPLELFLALGTQWNWAGLEGIRVGLRYEVIPPTAVMMGIAMTPELFGDIQDMEATALEVWAEHRERTRPRS